MNSFSAFHLVLSTLVMVTSCRTILSNAGQNILANNAVELVPRQLCSTWTHKYIFGFMTCGHLCVPQSQHRLYVQEHMSVPHCLRPNVGTKNVEAQKRKSSFSCSKAVTFNGLCLVSGDKCSTQVLLAQRNLVQHRANDACTVTHLVVSAL